MDLYVVLMFYIATSTDPSVPLEPLSAIMHYAADDSGRATCRRTAAGLNAELKRLGYATGDKFVCREMLSNELSHWEPGEADWAKRTFPRN